MKALLIVLVAAVAAAPALACGDGLPVNLVASASVKAGLTRAYVAAHPGSRARPVAGRTFYADDGGMKYAVASFGASPSVFTREPGGRWKLARDTNGRICDRVVPRGILTGTWWFDAYSSDCFTEPRA